MIEPVTFKYMKKAVAVFLLLGLLGSVLPAQSPDKKQNDQTVDYSAIREEILGFETALDDAVGSLSRGPFSLVNRVKGAYLQGFGINFTFLIDLNHVILGRPSRSGRRRPATPEQKQQWINELKERLTDLMIDKGGGLRHLRHEDEFAIVAHIDDRNPFEPGKSKTIIFRVLKKDLDELGNKNDQRQELKKRIKIFEY